MRARNEFGLVSDWSESVYHSVSTMEDLIDTGGGQQKKIPLYGSVLIGLGVVLVVGVISAAITVLCIVVHYRRQRMFDKCVSCTCEMYMHDMPHSLAFISLIMLSPFSNIRSPYNVVYPVCAHCRNCFNLPQPSIALVQCVPYCN